MDQNNINVVLILPNCTDHLQPLDISVNKAVKDKLCGLFQPWYAGEIYSRHKEQKQQEYVDLRMSVVKPLSATWMISTFNYIASKPEIIKMDFSGWYCSPMVASNNNRTLCTAYVNNSIYIVFTAHVYVHIYYTQYGMYLR